MIWDKYSYLAPKNLPQKLHSFSIVKEQYKDTEAVFHLIIYFNEQKKEGWR